MEELSAANNRIATLEVVTAAQRLALEKLGTAVEGRQRVVEALTGYQPPKGDPRSN
jgi:uncharacterized coiled-coil protein SlyX